MPPEPSASRSNPPRRPAPMRERRRGAVEELLGRGRSTSVHAPPSTRYCVARRPSPAPVVRRPATRSPGRRRPRRPAIARRRGGAAPSTAARALRRLLVASPRPRRYWTMWRPALGDRERRRVRLHGAVVDPVLGPLDAGRPRRRRRSSVTVGARPVPAELAVRRAGSTVAVVAGAARSAQSTRNQSKRAAFGASAPSETFRPTLTSGPELGDRLADRPPLLAVERVLGVSVPVAVATTRM